MLKLVQIKKQILDKTKWSRLELTELKRKEKMRRGKFVALGAEDGFCLINTESGEVNVWGVSKWNPLKYLNVQGHGPKCLDSYIYIAPDQDSAAKLRARLAVERDRHQHLCSHGVTWIDCKTPYFTQHAFKLVTHPEARVIIIGKRKHEIEQVGANVIRRESLDNWHVNMRSDFIEITALGSTPDAFYYSSNYKNGMLKVPVSHPKSHLLALAPQEYWEKTGRFWSIDKKRGHEFLDFDKIGQYLMTLSAKTGEFTAANMLSSGYYWNEKTKKCYARSGYITSGVAPEGVQHAYGRYIYVPKVPEEKVNISFFKRVFNSLCWADDYQAKVLLGWVLLAPFSGALKYRPHCWINGESSAGKTWVFENVIMPMLGKLSCGFTMGTTEAGLIRGLMGMALPIVHDEFESDSQSKSDTKRNLIEFFRGCSTSTGHTMSLTKGSRMGDFTQQFKACSMVLLGSIRNSLTTPQDASRFLTIELDRNKRKAEFKQIRYICEKGHDNLHNMFKAHIDRTFYNFDKVLARIEKRERQLMDENPDVTFHSLRCIAALDGMLHFYGLDFTKEEIKKMLDKFKMHDIKESESLLDQIFFTQFWSYSHKTCIDTMLRNAISRMLADKQHDFFDGELKRLGVQFKITDAGDAHVVLCHENRVFRHEIVKHLKAKNWRQLMLSDRRVEPVSERSIVIKNYLSFVGGDYGDN